MESSETSVLYRGRTVSKDNILRFLQNQYSYAVSV